MTGYRVCTSLLFRQSFQTAFVQTKIVPRLQKLVLLQFQVNPVPVEQFKQIAVQRSRLFLPVFGLGNLITLLAKLPESRG